jgi:hypothetical protein
LDPRCATAVVQLLNATPCMLKLEIPDAHDYSALMLHSALYVCVVLTNYVELIHLLWSLLLGSP